MNRFLFLGILSLGLVLVSVSALSEEKSDSAQKTVEKKEGAASTDLKTEVAEVAKVAPAKRSSSRGCLADEEIIEDLRKRKESLDSHLKELEKREGEMASQSRALDEEMKKLTAIRDEITGVQANQAKVQEEKVAKLVEALETMTPKAIAAMLNSLDERLAVDSMSKISTAKLAKVMNIMEPGRSSRLSELLAGVARAKNSIPKSSDVAVATPNMKGGENNGSNTINDQSASSGSGKREPASTESGSKKDEARK